MPSAMSEIVSRLPKLSPEELGQLKRRIDAYVAMAGVTVPKAEEHTVTAGATTDTSDEAFVLGIVCDTVFRISGGRYTVPMLRKQPITMKSLRRHLPGLIEFLKNVDKAQRPGFLKLCVEMVYHNLQHLKIPANAPTVVKHLHRIPGLVDVHFPGYHKNGLLRHIIRMGKSA